MTVTETVVELRRYRLHPGRRDELIGLFERELVEPQEAVGMRLIGQFTDQDEPDQFVWLRAFADMDARDRALRSFYGGPVWAEHRDAANATMLDSDDVLLLRPIAAARSFASVGTGRPSPGAPAAERGVLVTTMLLSQAAPEPLVETLADELSVAVAGVGGRLQGLLVSEHSPNTFTALPVREGENAVVWIADFADLTALDEGRRALRDQSPVGGSALQTLMSAPGTRAHHARLLPTARSLLPAVSGAEGLSRPDVSVPVHRHRPGEEP
jgi:hypothetical protein